MNRLKITPGAIGACVLAAFALVGCTSPMVRTTDAAYMDASAVIASKVRSAEANAQTLPVASTYLGSKSIPFQMAATLPPAFYVRKVLHYPGRTFTIVEAASIISEETGIKIRLDNDIFTAGPAGAHIAAAPITTNTSNSAKPPLPSIAAPTVFRGQSESSLPSVIRLDTTATAKDLLTKVCGITNLAWDVQDGFVVIHRLVTRSLVLKVQPGTQSFDTSIGKSGNGQAATNSVGSGGAITTGFTSLSTITKKSGLISAMDSATALVAKVLTPSGQVIPSIASGAIVVVDTIDGVRRAEAIIERENEILTRQATFHVQVISLKRSQLDQSGIDWNVAFQNLGKLGATLTSPVTLTNLNGGSIGASIVAGTSPGRFDTSAAFIKLLSEAGTVSTIYNSNVQTRNRAVTPVQALAQSIYLAQTTPGQSSALGTGGGTPGLTPGTLTVGFDMQLSPNILDSNQISLVLTLGVVDLIDIKTISSGTGQNQQSIEGPETAGYQFAEDVFITPGQTVLLTGYERTLNQYTERKLGRNVPLGAGGSFDGNQTKEQIFILITPVVIGNAF